ncbi:MAG: AAA family ATPase [Acholeplasmataceae bacterium]
MLKRKITEDLIKWYHNKDKKPLIVEGARQVGKTYIINEFASKFYGEQAILINFFFEPHRKELFEKDISPETLYLKFSLLYRKQFLSKKRVLLFLDEIQACPNAITALKSFAIDNRIDVIASGSLLGVHYNQVTSFPVGYVERLTLYPLDFKEFLWANGHEESLKILKNYYDKRKKVPNVIHEEFMKLFRTYIAVGGMPEVVLSFIKDNDFNKILKIQTRILNDYQDDIAKYATKTEKVRAREVFDSIPFQLGKDNKKFQYKYVSKGGRSSTYSGSIQWLMDAGIAYKCNALSNLEIPLPMYKLIDSFKLYIVDIGLLVSMLGVDVQTNILLNDLGIAKGAIYENIIGIILKQNGYNLYYYERRSGLEIDFVISKNNKVIAIEVKSGNNLRSKSLQTLIKEGSIDTSIRLSAKNINKSDKILDLPLYLSIFI